MADRVAVMYGGKIVEVGTAEEIFYNPQHPYTWGLLGSMPTLEGRGSSVCDSWLTTRFVGSADWGCFYPRNEFALQIDAEQQPPFFDVSPTHKAATWLLDPQAPKVTLRMKS